VRYALCRGHRFARHRQVRQQPTQLAVGLGGIHLFESVVDSCSDNRPSFIATRNCSAILARSVSYARSLSTPTSVSSGGGVVVAVLLDDRRCMEISRAVTRLTAHVTE
jgi:hypothetical protein